jgi:hypothetical protein
VSARQEKITDSEIVSSLSTVRPAALVSQQAADVLQTACDLLTAALDADAIAETSTQTLLNQFLETTMRRREAECHEAVARVFGRLSELRACGAEVIKWVRKEGTSKPFSVLMSRLVGDLKSMRAAQRQSAALSLGAIRYHNCPGATEKAVGALLSQLEPEVKVSRAAGTLLIVGGR